MRLPSYNARYYNPVLARFVSADSVVPGDASGSMDGIALKGLTVDFHEPGFAGQIGSENMQPFWFQMSNEQRRKAGSPWGPADPQALNRYSYVLNGPMRWTDPSGHLPHVLKAWEEWARDQHSAIEQWASDMMRKVEHAAAIATAGADYVTQDSLQKSIDWINSQDISESDKQTLRDLIGTAYYYGGSAAGSFIKALQGLATITFWLLKTGYHQSINDTLRRARAFERSNGDEGECEHLRQDIRVTTMHV